MENINIKINININNKLEKFLINNLKKLIEIYKNQNSKENAINFDKVFKKTTEITGLSRKELYNKLLGAKDAK